MPDTTSGGITKSRLTLHLGVIEVAYRPTSRSSRSLTTFDVAQFLEKKYGIFETFWKVKNKEWQAEIENSLQGALEALTKGQSVDPWGVGMSRMQARFKDWISSMEAERSGIPGTPTKAALRGINHRLEHPYKKSNPRRPSFKDTGEYMNSVRFWID